MFCARTSSDRKSDTSPPVSSSSAPAPEKKPLPPPKSSSAKPVKPAAKPVKPAAKSKSAPSKPKLTNEQFGKNVVAAQAKKLGACVEQDLLRDPAAPKAYKATVHIEKDGLPQISAMTFSPTPTSGFETCASNVIFRGFSGTSQSPPEHAEYTFTTSFSFPKAKPAKKAEHDLGWD